MKRAIVIAREVMEHHNSWGCAFAAGLRRHGWQAEIAADARPCDLLVVWGVRHVETLRRKAGGAEVCVLERGYVGDRFAWTSVSFGGGLNGRGIFRGPLDDGSRWARHFPDVMKPWRSVRDGYALIMGQVAGDSALAGVSIDAWYTAAARAYGAAGFRTVFRQHPNLKPRDGAEAISAARLSLHSVMDGAACVVTWNSNSGVDAVLAGVPTVAMDEGSMAWDVAGHQLGVLPPTPDRAKWAHALAWAQWRREEMADGTCWAAVGAPDAVRPA